MYGADFPGALGGLVYGTVWSDLRQHISEATEVISSKSDLFLTVLEKI